MRKAKKVTPLSYYFDNANDKMFITVRKTSMKAKIKDIHKTITIREV